MIRTQISDILRARYVIESLFLDLWYTLPIRFSAAPVAQLDRALASGARGCEFDPRQAHHSLLAMSIGIRIIRRKPEIWEPSYAYNCLH